ncbi:hypothetical protein KA005_70525 [bacterium]|nr:hypothetical protein [bacterium]
MTTTIEIQGLDELVKKLDNLAKLKEVKAGIRGAALHVRGSLSRYPPRKSIPISAVGGFASDKQRRWFFWALNKGKIQVPYRRTKALEHRWTIKTQDQGFTAIVGNNSPYARFVMGDKQTRMMQMIGWKTTEQVASEETRRVQEYVFDAVRRAIGA